MRTRMPELHACAKVRRSLGKQVISNGWAFIRTGKNLLLPVRIFMNNHN